MFYFLCEMCVWGERKKKKEVIKKERLFSLFFSFLLLCTCTFLIRHY